MLEVFILVLNGIVFICVYDRICISFVNAIMDGRFYYRKAESVQAFHNAYNINLSVPESGTYLTQQYMEYGFSPLSVIEMTLLECMLILAFN